MPERETYKLEDIVDVWGPSLSVRNYIEQADVRRIMAECSREIDILNACELGCGYGRMTMVLSEYSEQVHGFEREKAFVDIAKALIPGITFNNLESLSDTGAKDSFYDFILIFTVLQHISDLEVINIIKEIKRISKNGGYVLLCEETDRALRTGNLDKPEGFFTIGRSVDLYVKLMHPFKLVLTCPRQIEPGYSRKDVGTYMLFRNPRSR